jgi:predicted PurR-regulated permease PerM
MSETPDASLRSVPPREWRGFYLAVVFAAVALLFWAVLPVLSPAVLYVLLLILLSPYRGTREHLLLMVAVTIVVLLWLLGALGSILAPFLIAFVLAYILDPAADALERRGVPRSVAVAILLVPVLTGIVLALVFGIPVLVRQAGEVLESVPSALARIAAWLQGMQARLARMDLPFVSGEYLARQVDEQRIAAFIQAQQQAILERAWRTVLGVGRGFGFAITIIGYVVLTPVLTIYLLRDFNRLTTKLKEITPPHRRERWFSFALEYDHLLARFLRGQVLAALIVGVLTWVGLLIAGFPYPGLVAATAGVFNLVPYLGLIVSIVPVLIIALLSGSFIAAIIKAGIVFFIVQLIDGTITGPRIVGSSVGLHPVWVILALAVGSFFLGFVGLLLAMPAAVLIKLLLRDALTRYGQPAPAGVPEE